MFPVEFEGFNRTLAKDQPEYRPLPVHIKRNSKEGEVISCWKLSFKERVKLLFTGKIYWSQWTFNDPLQPQLPTLDNPVINNN